MKKGKKKKSKKLDCYRDILPDEFETVRVLWVDTCIETGWFTAADVAAKVLKMETLGWLIHRNDKRLLIAMSVGASQIGEVLVIPAGCIVEILFLDEEKE